MGESSSDDAGGADKMGKDNGVSRAVAVDDTALLLSAVESFRNMALGQLRKGSEASRILDQEMATRLLHLACKHDAVQCATLLLDGGNGITASLVDARDQLARTPLHIAAETHSARCIQLLLSRNARTDLRVIDGRPLVALEVALMSRRVQVEWSPESSVEDLLTYLQQQDLKAVRLLAEKTREVGEVAYRYAMEGYVHQLAMLLLVAEDKISATVSVVIDGVRTKRSIYNSLVDEVLSIGDASVRDGSERRKALLCEIQLLNQFGASSWRDRNIDRRILPPLLRAAKAGDMSVTKMLLMGDVDVNETDPEGNTALHWCLSSSSSTQEPRIVWLLLKSGAKVFQGNKLGLTPVHSAAAKGNYKALQTLLLHAQDCVDIPSKTKETPLFLAVKNGSLSCVQLLLRSGANPKVQNLRKQRPIDVATSQDMRFVLNSANVAPVHRDGFDYLNYMKTVNHGPLEKNRVMKKERRKELLDNDFDDYDNDDFYESYTMPKTPVGRRDFRSSNFSTQGAKSKGQSAPKQGPKLSRSDQWEKHDYTRKIFVGGLPPSVDNAYLSKFFAKEFGPVEEAIVITLKIDDRIQSRGFGFVKFLKEKDMIRAKEAHHVYVLGRRVEIKDAVARPFLPELQRGTSLRHNVRESTRVTNNEMEDELADEQYYLGKRRPLPEKCLPSWFFIFRKWLPGFLVEATQRYRERYPLSSVKTDFRSSCRMDLDHAALGYPKLSDFLRSLPGICRMCVVPVGKGPATHMVLLPPVSRPKYVPLLEPYSFDHDELPESVSDHQSPRSPLSPNNTEDAPHNTDRQHGDASSESNVQSQHDDEYSRSNAESPRDGDSTSNGSLLDEIAVSTTKLDLTELPARKPDLVVSGPLPHGNEPEPLRNHDLVESGPPPRCIETGTLRKAALVESALTRKLDTVESRSPGKLDLVEPGPARKLDLVQPKPPRNPDLNEPGPTKKLDLIESRPKTCFVDRQVERAPVTPSSCKTEMKFSFFQSQWDMYLTPHPKSDYCIICRSCEAAMELVPCLHKICVACMMRCNVMACMTCGTAVSGVKSSPSLDTKCRQGAMESVSDQKCQLMVVCSGADAIVKCSPCMHTIACRGCLLASVTLLKNCTVCNCMIEHFKFGSQGLAS